MSAIRSAVALSLHVPESGERGRRLATQTPLRAALVRWFHAHVGQWFELPELTSTLGRIPLDIENCLRELVAGGLVEADRRNGKFRASLPRDAEDRRALEEFLREQAPSTPEDHSDAARRFRETLGGDEQMLVVFESVRLAAKTKLSVLVLGPTGTGKELVARTIHELSQRRAGRFQAVNCAALPDTLFESELFGYEKGAFTGALQSKAGRMELANGGTLFLDEIGDLPPMSQAKLLRVLEERQLERLGGTRAIPTDFRLISATNRPLSDFVRDGRFRDDLYFRINAFTIRLPALRDRASDIPHLARRVLRRYCGMHELPPDAKVFSDESMARLVAYGWPGNVRELESVVFRAALSAAGRVIVPGDLEFLAASPDGGPGPAPTTVRPGESLALRDVEREHIRAVLEMVGGNKKQAARLLGIGRGTLYRKLREYGLEPPSPHAP